VEAEIGLESWLGYEITILANHVVFSGNQEKDVSMFIIKTALKKKLNTVITTNESKKI